ncbi:hypothetical protein EDC01DRAFT_621882 [Geopyxis carbonaria]|nr:hypothetical protein EDC01DRAFT_621882 [Geopyxis carbonaria]
MPVPRPSPRPHASANFLPMEIVELILGFIDPGAQAVFASTSKVCRQWYFASQQFLYRHPKISGKNYLAFVRSISPTSTNLKASGLGSLVKRLDLSRIVHEGKPSLNARLLHRVQASLEVFVAPQTSFGHICIVALGRCRRLRSVDLALLSTSIVLEDLFRHIGDLPDLAVLHFPRSSVAADDSTRFRWPPRLQRLSLGGSILGHLLREPALPPHLAQLSLSHCPFTRLHSVIGLLTALAPQLTTLSICYPMPCLPHNALDTLLSICPHLTYLLVSVDYISSHFFDDQSLPERHPLRQLDLASSGNLGVERKVSPNDVFIAAAGALHALRIVRVSSRLGWMKDPDKIRDVAARRDAKRLRQDVGDLVDMLEAKAEEAKAEEAAAGEAGGGGGQGMGGVGGALGLVGVWEFDGDCGDLRGGSRTRYT